MLLRIQKRLKKNSHRLQRQYHLLHVYEYMCNARFLFFVLLYTTLKHRHPYPNSKPNPNLIPCTHEYDSKLRLQVHLESAAPQSATLPENVLNRADDDLNSTEASLRGISQTKSTGDTGGKEFSSPNETVSTSCNQVRASSPEKIAEDAQKGWP